MWLFSGLVLFIAIQVLGAKKHHGHKEKVPRFVIPRPARPQSAFLPEATSVVKKSGSIVGTELPGAYGEDFDIDNGYESGGSSGASGSGSGSEKDDIIFFAREGEAPESAGKYGNNLGPSVGINPATAFVNHMKEADDQETDAEKGQIRGPLSHKKQKTAKSTKSEKIEKNEKIVKTAKNNKSEKQKLAKKRTRKKNKSPEANNMISKIDAIAKQIERVEHKEKLDRKEEATLKVAKKVAKKVIKKIAAKKNKKRKSGKKVAAVKRIEKEEEEHEVNDKAEITPVSSKEPEDCPLTYPYAYTGGYRCCKTNQDQQGVALSLTSQSCNSGSDKECPTGKCRDNKLFVDDVSPTSALDESAQLLERTLYIQNFKKSQENTKTQELVKEITKNQDIDKTTRNDDLQNSTERSNVVGAESTNECPWACFWKCHSYCPKSCCNNPYKCELACREFCTPYCSDQCCAPGSHRLPKLELSFGAENLNRTSPEYIKDNRIANLTPAESSYLQEKEREENISLANQIEALEKTSTYAAKLMGLPPHCPLACARICVPGLCSHQCCGKAHVIGVPTSCPASCSHTCHPALCSHQCCSRLLLPHSVTGFPPSVPAVALSDAQMYPSAVIPGKQIQNRVDMTLPTSSVDPFALNTLSINRQAIRNKLQETNALLPQPDQYNALISVNHMNRPKLKFLLEKALAARKEITEMSTQMPNWIHHCLPTCRSICTPACANECCLLPQNMKRG